MEPDIAVIWRICGHILNRFCIISPALFWWAFTDKGTSEYLPITHSWFAVELSQCLDKRADVNSMVKLIMA